MRAYVTLFLVSVVIGLVAPLAALSFDVSPDGSETCFQLDIHGEEDTTHFKIKYSSNISKTEISSASGTIRYNPSLLTVNVYLPNREDGTTTGDGRTISATHNVEANPDKTYSFRVSPTKAMEKASVGGGLFNLAKKYHELKALHGEYDVCFSKFKIPHLFGSIFSNSIPERMRVELVTFGSNPVSKGKLAPPTNEHPENGHVDHHDESNWRLRKNAGKKGEKGVVVDQGNVDHLWGHLHNVDRLIKEARVAADELHARHIEARSTSESTFSRIWFLSMVTMLAMAGSSYMMFRSIKGTIIKKKLV